MADGSCGALSRRRERDRLRERKRIRIVRGVCAHCGCIIERRKQGQDRAGSDKFCSRKCYAQMRSGIQEAIRRTAKLVSREIAALRRIAKAVPRFARAAEKRLASCKVCGNEFKRLRANKRFCGDNCAKKAIRASQRKAGKLRRTLKLGGYRKHKSAYKARRRARMVACRPFDPVAVLERDGWRCYLCGRGTPEALRGTSDPSAPEIDHVIPLALGGEHSMLNTRCACRSCNGAKGAKLPDAAMHRGGMFSVFGASRC